MADVQPFRGIRYNIEKAGSLSSIISPPYDVISPHEQQLYLEQSPYNVIRLELGEERQDDSPENNQYTRACSTLNDWLEKGILFQEQIPAFYIFEHRFIHQGVERRRWGLNARVRLKDWDTGWVRPHENTFRDRIGDRLELMRSCRANLSPIMGMFRYETEGLQSLLSQLSKGNPDLSALDLQGITHNVWIIREEKSIARLSSWCEEKAIYIADGHHRYETALAYQREQRSTHPDSTGNEAYNFVMMTLMDAGDPGVIMFPTHRLIRLTEPHSPSGLKDKLSPYFHLEELNSSGAKPEEKLSMWLELLEERGRERVAIGLYGLDKGKFYIMFPQEGKNIGDLMPPDYSQSWKDLDVAILHQAILRSIMGINTPHMKEDYLEYTQNSLEAISRVDSGEYHLAFLMNPIPVARVLDVADAGDRMPQKFTYFYPKLPTGFAIYPLWD